MNDEIVRKYIKNNYLRIIAKPNSPKTQIISYDQARDALRVDVHAKPENNEANVEIIKFFSKMLKCKIVLKSGARSKEKLLKI